MPLEENALTLLSIIKEELEITITDNDSILERYINAASEFILKYVERDLIRKTYTDERYVGTDSTLLYLDNYPVESITSIFIDDYELDETDGDYEITESDKEIGKLYRQAIWPATSKIYGDLTATAYNESERNITVTYIAGYCTPKQDDESECTRNLPYDIEEVCIGLVSRRYNIRCAGNQGQQNIKIGQFQTTWRSLLDDEYIAVLEKYKRRS